MHRSCVNPSSRITFLSFLMFLILVLSGFSTYAAEVANKTVEHAMGQTTVPDNVKRVVTLFQGATDSAVALGIRPVGVVDSWAEKPTYQYLRQKLEDVVHVGLESQPNLEKIAALHPDLIIGAKSRHEKIYDQLSKIAPTVLTDNVYDFKYTLFLTAQATGRESSGKKLWQQWEHRVNEFSRLLGKTVKNWPLTVSVIDVRADHLRVYLKNSFAGVVLQSIGFKLPNVGEKTGWGIKLKSKEALPAINADVFFVILHSDDAAVAQNYQIWRRHPLWKILNAPKNGQVYLVDHVTWLLSGGILGANRILDQLSDIYHLNQTR